MDIINGVVRKKEKGILKNFANILYFWKISRSKIGKKFQIFVTWKTDIINGVVPKKKKTI